MKIRRKSYLINKPYQLGLLGLLLLVVFIAIFISILTTHYFILVNIIAQIEKTGTFPDGVELINLSLKPSIIVLPLILIILACIFIYMLFVSHRTAGPMHHLCQAMEKVRRGDLSVRIKFRKNDEFQGVAETFNKMVEGLKDKFGVHKNAN
jgi:nitrogen fixation/metabolism regulation signal transduction histidine kinase